MTDPTGDLGVTRFEAFVLLFGWPAIIVTLVLVAALILWVWRK